MRLIALYLVRNEDWIFACTARAALLWCDALVICDHASTDSTPEIIGELVQEYPGRVFPFREDDPVFREMSFRQKLLERGRSQGGTHFALLDADELLTGNLIPHIREAVAECQPGQRMDLWMPALWASLAHYRADWTHWVPTAFADAPGLCWHARDGYDFHHRPPFGLTPTAHRPFLKRGGLMHLQFVNQRRLRAKQSWYKVQERLRWPGREPISEVDRKYSWWNTNHADEQPVPIPWWEPYRELLAYANFSERVEPWQERQVKEAVEQYGRDRFRGLDLFGVA